jgi:hypothetical protein
MDFSAMEFKPQGAKKLTVQYPKLLEIVGDVDDKMLRYALLMYDMNSPLRAMYPDLAKRKEWAASIAGYDLDKDPVQELFTLSITVSKDGEDEVEPNEKLLQIITKYIVYQNNRLWTLIVTNEQTFYEYHKRVITEIKDDGLNTVTLKTKLLEAMDDINGRLEVYYRGLTGEDPELEQAITKRRRLTAESQATR